MLNKIGNFATNSPGIMTKQLATSVLIKWTRNAFAKKMIYFIFVSFSEKTHITKRICTMGSSDFLCSLLTLLKSGLDVCTSHAPQ